MRKNTVILFYPKTEPENINKNIPLSILKVGSEISGAGYRVIVIDERFDREYENALLAALPDAVCFGASVMTGYQIKSALKASALVKKTMPEVPVVWGGWHPSILPEETLVSENIDAVIRGQGERTFSLYLNAVKSGKPLGGIEGLTYKENGAMISNSPRSLEDVNKLKPVNFELIDLEKYIFESPLGERTIFWNSSQGCPYLCGFCSTPAVFCRRWSGLNAEELLRQTKILADKYRIDGITFADDNFFVDVKRIEAFCRGIINLGLKIKWATDVRVDQINRFTDSLMGLLRESGCAKLYIGAESGDDEVLGLIDKKITAEDTYRSAEKLAKFGIISEFFMIVGFPVNPEKDLKESLEMIKKIKADFPDHQFTPFLYTPYPGTPLIGLAVQKGLKIPSSLEGWSDWSILSVNTPWVNARYLDKVNMFSKCVYPLAFPSSSLRARFTEFPSGFFYSVLHKLEKYRVDRGFFNFMLEWHMIKLFYKIKIRFNLFRSIASFR